MGGDIYVNGEANVPIAAKVTLKDHADKNGVFGSWGELAVVAKDPGNLASGAALGYSGNDNGTLKAEPGGGRFKTTNYSNDGNDGNDDGNNTIYNINEYDLGNLTFGGGGITKNGTEKQYEDLVNILEDRIKKIRKKIRPNDSEDAIKTVANDESIQGQTIRTIEESVIYENRDGNITIGGDIQYDGNASYETLESIPKIIIYAKNIDINCDVDRIDAILIAEGDIDTCPDKEGKNAERSAENSKKLQINGAVIAGGTLRLNRTYGAATGYDSIVPAEVINMDPSWFLWAADIIPETVTTGNTNPTDTVMVPTYMNELPPRY